MKGELKSNNPKKPLEGKWVNLLIRTILQRVTKNPRINRKEAPTPITRNSPV